ncbi:MAG: hypothetical protein ACNA77_03920 [Opitutales bacterium]
MSLSKKNIQPNWRPNFVITSELPDIKVVRTGFIINFIFIALMLAVGFYVMQREYRAHAIRQTIATIEQRIQVAQADDAMSLKLSQEFRTAAAHILDLEKFTSAPFQIQDFLVQLTQMRPEKLIFKQISVTESEQKDGANQLVIYRINLTGEVSSLTLLDEFKGALSGLELLNYQGYTLVIDETLQGRDAETGIFPYTLQITLRPEKPSPPAGA